MAALAHQSAGTRSARHFAYDIDFAVVHAWFYRITSLFRRRLLQIFFTRSPRSASLIKNFTHCFRLCGRFSRPAIAVLHPLGDIFAIAGIIGPAQQGFLYISWPNFNTAAGKCSRLHINIAMGIAHKMRSIGFMLRI